MKLTLAEIDIARGAAIFRDLSDVEFTPVVEASNLRALGDGAYFFMEEDPVEGERII